MSVDCAYYLQSVMLKKWMLILSHSTVLVMLMLHMFVVEGPSSKNRNWRIWACQRQSSWGEMFWSLL